MKFDQFKIQQAVEPQDVIWENYGLSKGEKILSRSKTIITTILVMFIVYSCIWFLKYYQINNFNESFQFLIVSLIISLIISLINILLRFLIRKFVFMEKRTNFSEQEDSIIVRIGISYFLTNALIVPITYKTTTGEWVLWKERGVIFTITLIMIFSIIFDGLYDIIHIEYLIQLIKRYWLNYKIKKNQLVFQDEANRAYEGYEFDIAERYFQLIKVLSVCLFYQAILPYGLLIGCVEIFVTYWIQKYTLYKYVNKPR